jgi:chemotaxis protein CheC
MAMTQGKYTELQLDALREVANTGAGYAAADLSEMIGTSVSISVPRAIATALADAIDELGAADEPVTSVMVAYSGDLEAVLVSIYSAAQARAMCEALGLDPTTDLGQSMLAESGNVLACAYGGVIGEMANLRAEIGPPVVVNDMLGALVSTLSARINPESDTVLLIDSELAVHGSDIGLSVLFVPTSGGIETLLTKLGLGSN